MLGGKLALIQRRILRWLRVEVSQPDVAVTLQGRAALPSRVQRVLKGGDDDVLPFALLVVDRPRAHLAGDLEPQPKRHGLPSVASAARRRPSQDRRQAQRLAPGLHCPVIAEQTVRLDNALLGPQALRHGHRLPVVLRERAKPGLVIRRGAVVAAFVGPLRVEVVVVVPQALYCVGQRIGPFLAPVLRSA